MAARKYSETNALRLPGTSLFVYLVHYCVCIYIQERLRAYAGMLEWNPVDPNEEEPKEKTYETLSEE